MDRTERMSSPLQAPDALLSREARMQQVQQQREVIAQLRHVARSAGDAPLLREADALEFQYVVADRALLGDDVYRSAAHQPAAAGLGYYRGSENPGMVRALGVNWTDKQIADRLQPNDSDARAEIYIPDPAVFGPDAKPVIAYKGSNGLVFALDERGVAYLRESAPQDWTENGRQGLGMESSHYDRSMDVATAFQSAYNKPFDNVGHSKGGGQAQAASATTGMPAYTFNSATLHPATAARYVEQNGGTLFDAAALNHGYYVKGEVLHDGLALTQSMDAGHQQQLGDTIRYVGELAQMPHVRSRAQQTLGELWPYDRRMQQDAMELIDTLAKDAGAQTLRQAPQPAVNLVALDATQRDASGALVDRVPNASLADVERNAGPVLGILATTGAAMVVGKRVGDGVAAGGRAVEYGAEAVGSTVDKVWQMSGQVVRSGAEAQGTIVGGSIRYGGEAVAGMRVAGGHAEALVDHAQAQVAEWSNATSSRVLRAASQLPLLGGLHQVADQRDRETAAYVRDKHGDAAAAVRGAARDAAEVRQGASNVGHTVTGRYSTVGATFDAGLRRVGVSVHGAYSDLGGAVRGTTAWAPEAGAALIGAPTLTAKAISTHVPSAPVDLPRAVANVTASRELVAHVRAGAASEAVARHAQQDSVQPSVDAHTRELEARAFERAQRLQHTREPAGDSPAADRLPGGKAAAGASAEQAATRATPSIDDPRHPAFSLFSGAERGVLALDAQHGRTPDLGSRQLAGALAAGMHQAGATRVDHVVLGRDQQTVFGVQGRLADATHLRAGVDARQGMETPLAQSTQRVADVDMQQAQQRQLAQEAPTLPQPQVRMQVG